MRLKALAEIYTTHSFAQESLSEGVDGGCASTHPAKIVHFHEKLAKVWENPVSGTALLVKLLDDKDRARSAEMFYVKWQTKFIFAL